MVGARYYYILTTGCYRIPKERKKKQLLIALVGTGAAAWGASDGQGNDTGRISHAPAKGHPSRGPAARARGYRVKPRPLCLPDVVEDAS